MGLDLNLRLKLHIDLDLNLSKLVKKSTSALVYKQKMIGSHYDDLDRKLDKFIKESVKL